MMAESENDLRLASSKVISTTSNTTSKTGLFFVGLTGGVAIGLSVICLPFVSPALRRICLPYVPATTTQVNNVLNALRGRSGKLVDLGSGDGRIVLSAAHAGFRADGVELNPWLVAYSRFQAVKQGFYRSSRFYRKDLWKFDLRPYNNIVIFGVQEMMPELQQKLGKELQDGGCVVACRFPFPDWQPSSTLGEGNRHRVALQETVSDGTRIRFGATLKKRV